MFRPRVATTQRVLEGVATTLNRKVNETYLEVEVCLTFYRPRAPTKVKCDRRHPISFHPSKALTIMINTNGILRSTIVKRSTTMTLYLKVNMITAGLI